jgi:hypothetical protein
LLPFRYHSRSQGPNPPTDPGSSSLRRPGDPQHRGSLPAATCRRASPSAWGPSLPSFRCTWASETPSWRCSEAKVCRRSWGEWCGSPAAFRPLLNAFATLFRSRRVPSLVAKTQSGHG